MGLSILFLPAAFWRIGNREDGLSSAGQRNLRAVLPQRLTGKGIIGACPQNEMIRKIDADGFESLDDGEGGFDIRFAGGGVAAGMVVGNQNMGRVMPEG